MRKISKMYELSGGFDRQHKCSECGWYYAKTCMRHPETPEFWDGDWMSCRWFMEKKLEENTEDNLDGQMTIFDLMKGDE